MDIQDIKAAQTGDLQSFEKLAKTYDKKIYNIALRISNNSEDAFDLTQDVFLKIYKNLPNFKFESELSTWIYRITSNVCIDFARKQAKKKKLESSFITKDDDGQDVFFEVPDLRYNPETQIEKNQLKIALNNAIARLSPEHRQIFVLRELTGLTYLEIAQVLSIEEGTVKSRISRSREKLRIFLSDEGNFSPYNMSK